jgi:hypothetical protein
MGSMRCVLPCRWCRVWRDPHDHLLPASQMGISIRPLDTPCLISPCKIPANSLSMYSQDLSPGSFRAPLRTCSALSSGVAEATPTASLMMEPERADVRPNFLGETASLSRRVSVCTSGSDPTIQLGLNRLDGVLESRRVRVSGGHGMSQQISCQEICIPSI